MQKQSDDASPINILTKKTSHSPTSQAQIDYAKKPTLAAKFFFWPQGRRTRFLHFSRRGMIEEKTLCSNYSTSTISRNLLLLRVPSMILESSSLSLVYPLSCLPILPPLPHLLQRHLLEKQQRCRKRSTNVNIVIEHSVGVNIEADMRGRVSLLVS